MKRVQVIIKGKVQGVWYRKSTKEKADQLGILGTVQNLPDGSVQVVALAEKAIIDQFLIWAKEGSRLAVVNAITVSELDSPQQFEDFQIIS